MSALVWRELRLAASGGHVLLPPIFFLLVATLFPFAVGPDAPLLARTGGGALWMAALLAALLPVERLVDRFTELGYVDDEAFGIKTGERNVAAAGAEDAFADIDNNLVCADLVKRFYSSVPRGIVAAKVIGTEAVAQLCHGVSPAGGVLLPLDQRHGTARDPPVRPTPTHVGELRIVSGF